MSLKIQRAPPIYCIRTSHFGIRAFASKMKSNTTIFIAFPLWRSRFFGAVLDHWQILLGSHLRFLVYYSHEKPQQRMEAKLDSQCLCYRKAVGVENKAEYFMSPIFQKKHIFQEHKCYAPSKTEMKIMPWFNKFKRRFFKCVKQWTTRFRYMQIFVFW